MLDGNHPLDSVCRDPQATGVLGEDVRVGGDVDAVDLVGRHVAVQPADVGPQHADDLVRLRGPFPQLLRSLLANPEDLLAAGVTKGALYHHFGGKEQLFRVVFESVKRELSRVVAAAQWDRDPWIALLSGCRTFIEAHTDAGVQRIVLLDARAVLSWEAWHEVDSQYGTVILRAFCVEPSTTGSSSRSR